MSCELDYCHGRSEFVFLVQDDCVLSDVRLHFFPLCFSFSFFLRLLTPNSSHVATSISGNAGYDCYRNVTLTAGQSIILAAEGQIGTSRPATVANSVAWVSSWYSRSIITTTAWPTPTVADLYHPAVNFLVTGQAAAPTSGSSSSTSSSPAFSLFKLSLGTSIGILVAIAIGGLIFLCCLFAILRRIIRGRKAVAQPAPPAYYPTMAPTQPPPPMEQQYPTGGAGYPSSPPAPQYPGSPPPPVVQYPPAQYTPTPGYGDGTQSPPPVGVPYGQGYPGGGYPSPQPQYGYSK